MARVTESKPDRSTPNHAWPRAITTARLAASSRPATKGRPAITVHFRHNGFASKKYDEAVRRLDAAGLGAPAGRLNHVAFEADGEVEVFDVWESQRALEAFGPEGFVPILTELGVELHPPTIHPVHNSIQG